ncbi:hypothetical protein DXG01_004810 [Tephrocybe rancida]|nr:hypothetical protein DXG01_004810 [Tephrocybe rancida]
MPNPGIFHGTHKAWLLDELPTYAAAVCSGCLGDIIPDINRCYFKCHPPTLPLNQEPTPEVLALINDSAPDPECPPIPDVAEVGEAAHTAALVVEMEYKNVLTKQLGNFFQYQYGNSLELMSTESGPMNPYTAFHHKFLGLSTGKPHCKSAHSIWRHTHRDEVKTEFEQRTHRAFNALPGDEKLFWESKACEEFETDTKAWKNARSAPPPTDPASRQRAIEQTPSFATPFLNALRDTTGWKWLLIGGGLEPADGANIGSSISSKDTTGPVRLSFVQSQRESYKKSILPIWASHLHMSHSITNTPSVTNPSASTGKCARMEPSNDGLSPKRQLIDTISAPNNAPAWFKSALEMLQTEDLGPQWRKLLLGWVDFKVKALFANAAPLPPGGRPTCVSVWIQRAHSSKWHPTVDIDTIKASFKGWFKVIHPIICRSGKNGFLSILTALFFWAHGLLEEDSNGVSWDKVVADVSESFLA